MMMKIRLVAASIAIVAGASQSAIAETACMTRAEARKVYPRAHLYWHGRDHCWDAKPVARTSTPLKLSRFRQDRPLAGHQLADKSGETAVTATEEPTPNEPKTPATDSGAAPMAPKAIPTIAVSQAPAPQDNRFAQPAIAASQPEVTVVPADEVNAIDLAADAVAAEPAAPSGGQVADEAAKADAARVVEKVTPTNGNASWFGRLFAAMVGGALAAGAAIKMLVG